MSRLSIKISYLKVQILAWILGASISQAIIIRVPSLEDDRFAGGTPGATQNATFQYDAYDFSGVGWDTTATARSVTLISDRHIVAALHNQPNNNVSFRDEFGVVHAYTVSSWSTMSNADYPSIPGNSDLRVGTLSTSVASGINFYPLLDPSINPVGLNTFVYGQNGKIGEAPIVGVQAVDVSGTQGVTLASQYVKAGGGPDDARGSGGDSGGPSFFMADDGSLVLAGVHWAIDDDVDNHYLFDTYTSAYINQLNNVSGLTVVVSNIPEPANSLFMGLAVMSFVFRRQR